MKRNTRWYLSAAAAGALLAGAALWAARTFPAAPAAVPGFFGLAGGLLFFCAMAELLSTRDLDPARRERDREDGLIYADPPYVKTERIYRIVGKTRRFRKFHVRLWQVLSACKGYVVLSYNDCPFIRKLYRDWYILSFQRGNPLSQKKGASFGELILTNYDPRPYMTRQLNLFDESLGEWELKLVHIPNHPPRRKESPAGCRASNQNLLQ